jgi:hypothetical protein
MYLLVSAKFNVLISFVQDSLTRAHGDHWYNMAQSLNGALSSKVSYDNKTQNIM